MCKLRKRMMNSTIRRMPALLLAVGLAAFTLLTAVANLSSMEGGLSNGSGVDYSSSSEMTVTDVSNRLDRVGANYLNKMDAHAFLKADDIVDVVVQMHGDSLVDSFSKQGEFSSVSHYAKSSKGQLFMSSLTKGQNTLISELRANISLTPKIGYTGIMNGFSAEMRYGDIAKLKENANIKSVVISEMYAQPLTVEEDDGSIRNPVNVYETGIYDSSRLEFDDGSPIDGKGMLVSILDTGIDYAHEVFQIAPEGPLALTKGEVSEIIKDTAAWEMNTLYAMNGLSSIYDLSANDVYMSDKVPFVYNYADISTNVQPNEGHGTHVSGIIAGNSGAKETIRGVAPNAQIAFMQVFGSEGAPAYTSTILMALNDAVLIDSDVINMSLGIAMGFSKSESEITDGVYQSIEDAGISLVVAVGNDFSSGFGSNGVNLASNPDSGAIGSPATYESAMGVASISGVLTDYALADGKTPLYLFNVKDGLYQDKNFIEELLVNKDGIELDYVKVPGIGAVSDYMNLGNITGKVAVVKRGSLTFESKAAIAQAKGAVACIIYNNVSGTINMLITDPEIHIPVCSISFDEGEALPSSGKIRFNRQLQAGPFMSDYSSWGAMPDLSLKPDITAHGGLVYSSVPGNLYDRYSGTSMAAPNTAGATVLLRQYFQSKYPNYTKQEIYEIVNRTIMSTATTIKNQEGNPYSPRKQGAGLADIYNAISTKAYLYVEGKDKVKLAIGDDKARTGIYDLEFKIRNTSSTAISYEIVPYTLTEKMSSDEKTVSEISHMLSPSMSVSCEGDASASGNRFVSLRGYGDATVRVQLNLYETDRQYLNKNFENGMYVEGFIQFVPTMSSIEGEADITLSIPWLGFYGDWTEAPLMDVSVFDVAASMADTSVSDDDKLKASVFASRVTGYYNVSGFAYELPLGEFSFTLENENDKPSASMDKIAVSESIYASYALASIQAGLIRSAKTVNYSITNDITQEVVYQNTASLVSKAHYSPSSSEPEPAYVPLDLTISSLYDPENIPVPPTILGLPNNSKYNFSMTATLDYEGEQKNKNNSFDFSFYVDSDAPLLNGTSLRIEETAGKKRYYLELNIHDNHYLEAMILGTFSDMETFSDFTLMTGNYVMPLDTKRNTTSYISYDITDYWDLILKNDERIYLEVYDYAKNSSAFLIDLPRVQATEFSFSQEQVTIGVNETIDLKTLLQSNPENAWKFNLDWYSPNNNNNVMIEGGDGEIMGLNPTGSPITISVKNRDGDRASIKVSVVASNSTQPETKELKMSYSVDGAGDTGKQLIKGDTGQLSLSLTPWNSKLPEIEWISRSEHIVFDTTGKTTASGGLDIGFKVQNLEPRNSDISATVTATIKGTTISTSITFKIEKEFEVEGRVLIRYNGHGSDGNLIIPDYLNVSTIGPNAFAQNPGLVKVKIPKGVDTISYLAFVDCPNLEEVELSDTVKTIDQMAFNECYKLRKINLTNVITISANAFTACKELTDIDLKNVQFIGTEAFAECDSIKYVDISNVRYMGASAFMYSGSINTIITSSITHISNDAFAGDGGNPGAPVENLVLRGRYVGVGAFAYCTQLKSVLFEGDDKIIEQNAFYGCNTLQSVIFRGTVREIKDAAFSNCRSLRQIRLPDGLEKLGENVFQNCDRLETVILPNTASLVEIGGTPFAGSSVSTIDIEPNNPYLTLGTDANNDLGYIYNAAKTKLLLAMGSRNAEGRYTVPEAVREIGNNAFLNNKAIKILDREGTQPLSIGENAFNGSGLHTITSRASQKIEKIGYQAFAFCKDLTTFNPGALSILRHIDIAAFADSGLANFNADLKNLEYFGAYAFYNCKGLSTFNSSVSGVLNFEAASIESIDMNSFYGSAFREINLGNTIKSIGELAFGFSPQLTELNLPMSLVEIGSGAFYACERITEIILPESVQRLLDTVFADTSINTIKTKYIDGTIENGMNEVVYTGYGVFYQCPIVDFRADRLVIVGGAMFAMNTELGRNEHIKTVSLPKALYIDDAAFAGCTSLVDVNLPRAISIGVAAFEDCFSLQNINVPSVKSIGMAAFIGCYNMTYIELPNAERIDAYAFADCLNLYFILLERLVSIGDMAFAYTAINRLTLPKTLEDIDDGAFFLMPYMSTIYVEKENPNFFSVDGVLYSHMKNGGYQLEFYPINKLESSYTVLEGTVRIADAAFFYNQFIQEITLPWSLRTIGDGAFLNCVNLLVFNFLSFEAPILESYMIADSYPVSYTNFVNYISQEIIATIIPENGVGYDNYIYQMFFFNISKGPLTPDYITKEVIDLINSIPQDITLESAALIEQARLAYDSILKEEQRNLITNYSKLLDAERILASLSTEEVQSFSSIMIAVVAINGALILIFAGIIVYVSLSKKRRKA